jgi:hypothetical protein
MSKLKMHIILRWDLSPEAAVIAASHASLGTYLTYKDDPIMQEWQRTSFVKVIHRALHLEHWQFCKTLGQHRIFTESKLDNMEVSLGFNILKNPTHLFNDIPLWTLNPQ